MEILDYLFEKGKPSPDESEIVFDKTVFDGLEALQSLCLFAKWKGEPRERSQVTIYWDGSMWVARLSDSDNRRSSSASGSSVQHAIANLDAQLCSGEPRWYYWPTNGPGKKKGK